MAAKRAMLRIDCGVLSAEAFADRLGLRPRELEDAPLFWLDVDGHWVYPAFQLAEDGLLPGIRQVAEAFIEDPWMRVNFMLTGDVRLGKRSRSRLRIFGGCGAFWRRAMGRFLGFVDLGEPKHHKYLG